MSTIHELTELQRRSNDLMAAMTPQERSDAAREQLRYIASVEPEMAWVLEALGPEDDPR